MIIGIFCKDESLGFVIKNMGIGRDFARSVDYDSNGIFTKPFSDG